MCIQLILSQNNSKNIYFFKFLVTETNEKEFEENFPEEIQPNIPVPPNDNGKF